MNHHTMKGEKMKKKIGIAKTTIHKGWHDLDELNTKIGHFEHCGCPECISKKVKHMVIDKVYMTHKKLLSVTHQTESLRERVQKTDYDWIIPYVKRVREAVLDKGDGSEDREDPISVLKAVVIEHRKRLLSEWERVKLKEMPKKEQGGGGILWDKGYDTGIYDADTAVKELLK